MVIKVDDAISSRHSLVLKAETVLQAISQAASKPEEYCEPLLRASTSCLESLMESLDPSEKLPTVIIEVLKSLYALLKEEKGLLRYENLLMSRLDRKDFASLFGFSSLDKVQAFAQDVEHLVTWDSFSITNGAARVAVLKAFNEKERE